MEVTREIETMTGPQIRRQVGETASGLITCGSAGCIYCFLVPSKLGSGALAGVPELP